MVYKRKHNDYIKQLNREITFMHESMQFYNDIGEIMHILNLIYFQ